jgi:hypothetical protein
MVGWRKALIWFEEGLAKKMIEVLLYNFSYVPGPWICVANEIS